MKPFDKLFFDSSVGLGDAFVMNGIVHHFVLFLHVLLA